MHWTRIARLSPAIALASLPLLCAGAQIPLELLTISGSKVSREAVTAVSGLKIGSPVDKAAIEEACKRLQATGLFSSVEYTYRPGPKQGFAVTISLQDAGPLIPAAIDIPGADEPALWKWMMSLNPAFGGKIPGGAQDYLAAQIERQAAASLGGQHVVARQEADFLTHKSLISFQPEKLPEISSVAFEGQHAISPGDLQSILAKVLPGQGYTERSFRFLVENNLRPAYEDLGMYRVQFPSVRAQKAGGASMAVTLAIAEGPVYSLGQVELTGDNLPPDLSKSANLPVGQVANWTLIQKGLWAMQSRLVLSGYLDAAAQNQRNFDDTNHVLNLKVAIRTGPLYRFGQVTFTGLPPNLETIARNTWNRSSADVYDIRYPQVFMRDLAKQTDLRQFQSKAETSKKQNATVDINMIFTAR